MVVHNKTTVNIDKHLKPSLKTSVFVIVYAIHFVIDKLKCFSTFATHLKNPYETYPNNNKTCKKTTFIFISIFQISSTFQFFSFPRSILHKPILDTLLS